MRISDDSRFYLLAILLVIATTAAYSNHFFNSFHFDDSHAIVNNVYIKDIRNIPLFFRDGGTFSSLPTNQSYRPVVTTTLAIDYWLGKGLRNTFYFHLSTFILFLAQGVCMYFLYLGIFRTSFLREWNRHAALFATAWYLLHPAGAETINYIIARSDSLSTLFVILSLVLFVHSPVCRRFHLYLLPLAVGCLAKPIAAVFAPLLLAYVLLFEENPSWTDPFRKTLPSFAFCLVLLVFIGKMEPLTWAPGGASRYHYVITQPYVILRYFTTFFLPFGLSADTDWKPLASVADVRFVAGSLFVAALLVFAILTARKDRLRPISFGILWFLITLLPTSLIPLAEVTNDHRVFFPYVGLVMAVSWTIALALARRKESAPPDRAFFRGAAAGIAILLAAYAYGTFQRNTVWRSEETLWRDVARKSPENCRGLMNYGLVLMGKGDYGSAGKYFTDALMKCPSYSYLYVNMGVLKAATGEPGAAERFFRDAIALGPGYPECYFHYAKFLKGGKRYDEAAGNLEKALKLAPAHLDARNLLMDVYFEHSRFGNLEEWVGQTLLVSPNDPKALFYRDVIERRKTFSDG
jgi:tetratricopeptide (TPR) repeat protein